MSAVVEKARVLLAVCEPSGHGEPWASVVRELLAENDSLDAEVRLLRVVENHAELVHQQSNAADQSLWSWKYLDAALKRARAWRSQDGGAP